MAAGGKVTLFHAPNTRSSGTLILLEELGLPPSMCPYGDFDTMLNTVRGQLQRAPYMCGEKFTSADVLWGTAINWMLNFKLVPESPELTRYRDAFVARPAYKKVTAADAKLAAEHEAAAAKKA